MPDEPSGGAGWLHRMFSILSPQTSCPPPYKTSSPLAICSYPSALSSSYWAPVTSACTQSRDVCASDFWAKKATLCYVVTAPILGQQHETDLEDIRLKVMRVKFITLSCDPGKCSDEFRGTYSYSWFEAAILRPSQMPAVAFAPYEWRSWLTRVKSQCVLSSTPRNRCAGIVGFTDSEVN
ncbi:hypothetical protein B0H19DRAFT_1059975 [Mycena capillaripes]|nr:hypothetical protein B0H19DRAFT_1059975 [Mycena capillaripes]